MTVVQAAMDGANGIDIDGRNIRVAFASEKPQGERARMRQRSWGCHRSCCGGACGCSLEIARLRARFQAAAAAAATVAAAAVATVAAVIVINDMRLRILLPALAALCSFGVFCSSSARRRASASRQFSEQCKCIASCNIVPKMRAKNARDWRFK